MNKLLKLLNSIAFWKTLPEDIDEDHLELAGDLEEASYSSRRQFATSQDGGAWRRSYSSWS